MPIATGTGDNQKRYDLKTLPGGYVILRRLTWGEQTVRKGFMSTISLMSEGSNRAERRSKGNQNFMAELRIANEQVTAFDFANCIVEHNLTYLARPGDASSEVPLNFKNEGHVKMLDGAVGGEIDMYINEWNEFEGEEDTGKSSTPSVQASLAMDSQTINGEVLPPKS